MQKKLFSILALLLMAVVGATAQTTYSVTVKADNTHIDSEIGGPVTVTIVQATSFKVEGVTFYYVQGMTFNLTLTL